MPENVLMGQHLSKACWELWLSDDQPHSDYNGQWQRALCILAVLQSSQPNPQRNEKMRKMYAIKQIKICAEYRDMLPRPRLDLSCTPGLRPIGLSPGSWQTSLGLGSMTRYSAQIASLITSLTIVYSIVYSDTDQRKHQSSTSLAFVRGIHRGPVNSPHKWPVTRKMFPFCDVIMRIEIVPCGPNKNHRLRHRF